MKTKTLLLSVLLGSLPLTSAHALAISSETKPFLDINYGESVLNTLLSKWQKPQIDVSGVTAVTIRLAKDGRPYSCEIRHHSSSLDVDNSICQTVSQIGQFQPLKANDNGEVYLTFVHDNKPFLQANTAQNPVNAVPAPISSDMAGSEQVDTVRNSVSNPIQEIQKSSQIDVESSSIIEENVPMQPAVPVNVQSTQPLQNNAPIPVSPIAPAGSANPASPVNPVAMQNTQNMVPSSSLPVATEPQPNTIRISREEALQAPSANLADPAQFTQAYSYDVLRQASPKIRIPSNLSGKYQVIARIDVLGDGKLKNAQITKSSQNRIIDEEILRVLTQEVQYAPLPNKIEQSMWLTFNITK